MARGNGGDPDVVCWEGRASRLQIENDAGIETDGIFADGKDFDSGMCHESIEFSLVGLTPVAESELSAILTGMSASALAGHGHVAVSILDCVGEPAIGLEVRAANGEPTVAYWKSGALDPTSNAKLSPPRRPPRPNRCHSDASVPG